MNFFKKLLSRKKDRTLYDAVTKRYSIAAVQSFPPMLHRNNRAILVDRKTNIALTQNNMRYLLGFNLRRDKNQNVIIKPTPPITLQSLLNDGRGLEHLIGGLWRIYRSNNLQLRQSFVSLVKNVNQDETAVNKSSLMLYRLMYPHNVRAAVNLIHYSQKNAVDNQISYSSENLERLIEEKLKSAKLEYPQYKPMSEAELYKNIVRRLERAQKDEWRCEKLRRGLF